MGSLLPDSSSSRGRRRPRSPALRARRTENTAAASVEEMMAPSRNPASRLRPSARLATQPAMSAVTSTPTVASAMPGAATGRTSDHRVSRPPANRMKARAITPMVPARS